MATSKKTVAKQSKKAAPSPKKPVAAKNTKATKPVAKKQAKPVAKKAVPSKKTVAAPKKAAPKAKAPAKKAASVNAKTVKKVEVAKKTTSSKSKTVTAKKTVQTAPVKKTTKVAAKPAPKAPAPKTPAPKAPVAPKKPEVKAPAVQAAKPAPVEKAKKPAKAPVKKIVKTITQSANATPSRPLPSTVSRVVREEKKPNVIVAHRKLENKSKQNESSRTLINYQPEFKSILDEPQQDTGPVYRYSDEELNEFRELINGRMEAARKELLYLQGLITRKDEAGTEDTENRYMNMEDGSGAMEREQLAQLASRQIQFISHLEKALMRIENKTYGICRVTGKLIDKARLRAVPHATLSIEAKKTMAK